MKKRKFYFSFVATALVSCGGVLGYIPSPWRSTRCVTSRQLRSSNPLSSMARVLVRRARNDTRSSSAMPAVVSVDVTANLTIPGAVALVELPRKRKPRGPDFSAGAWMISDPDPQYQKRFWRPIGRKILEKVQKRIQAEIDWVQVKGLVNERLVPQMPKEWLMAAIGLFTTELVKREVSTQVVALPAPVQEKAWALLNETYRSLEIKVTELSENDWNYVPIVQRELAGWARRGLGNSTLEALVTDLVQLQGQQIIQEWTTSAEGKTRIGLDSTYREVRKLLPPDVLKRIQNVELVVKKLERSGLGFVTVDDIYSVATGGDRSPPIISDLLRLLLITNTTTAYPIEGHDAQSVAGSITLDNLLGKLNSTAAADFTRAATYAALVAESEAIDSIRAALDDIQAAVEKGFTDVERQLGEIASQPPPKSHQLNAGMWARRWLTFVSDPIERVGPAVSYAAMNVTKTAKDAFTSASGSFNAAFERLADPSTRGLPRSSQLLPWKNWYQSVWNKMDFKKAASEDESEDPDFVAATVALNTSDDSSYNRHSTRGVD